MRKKLLFIFLFLIIIMLVIVFCIPYLCKARVNDMVKSYSSKYISSLSYSDANLNLIRHFPDVAVVLSDFELKSGESNFLAAEKIDLMVGLSSILKKEFTNVKEMVVKNGTVTCENINGNSELYAYGVNMSVKNNDSKIKGEMMAKDVSYAKDGLIYFSGVSLDAVTNGLLDLDNKVYTFNNSDLKINDLNVNLDGDMSFQNNNLKFAVSFLSDQAPLADIVNVFYRYFYSPEKVNGSGIVSGSFDNLTTQGQADYLLSLSTEDGKIGFGDQELNYVALDGKVDIRPEPDGYVLSIDSKKFVFNDVVLGDLVGDVVVEDHKYDLSSLKFNVLDGVVTASGSYDIHNASSFTANIDAKSLDLSKMKEELPSISAMVPLNDSIVSSADLKLRLNGNISGAGVNLNTLKGNGELHSDKIAVKDSKSIETLRTLLRLGNKYSSVFEDVDIFFTIANGRMKVSPFTTHIDNLKLNVSGDHGFDGGLNYLVKAEMPRSDMGETVNSIINSISRTAAAFGFNVPVSDAIKLNVKISGTFDSPIVTPVN